MIRNIKAELRQNLHKLDWLDEEAKEMTVEKLISSVEDIASPRNLREDDDLYGEVN